MQLDVLCCWLMLLVAAAAAAAAAAATAGCWLLLLAQDVLDQPSKKKSVAQKKTASPNKNRESLKTKCRLKKKKNFILRRILFFEGASLFFLGLTWGPFPPSPPPANF